MFIGRTDAEAEAPIFWLPDVKSQLIGKTLMPRKIEDKKRRGQQWMRWLDSITDSTVINLRKLQETVEDKGAWHAKKSMGLQRARYHLATTTVTMSLTNIYHYTI